jgi:hypothetical protein
MLWIYAGNDHFFGPQLAQNFYTAFTKNGGKANFIAAPAFGDDGHQLFSLRGIPVWTPMVDDFLYTQNLVLRKTMLQVSAPPVDPPANLSKNARDDFQLYLLSAPHKAFATSSGKFFRFSTGRRTAPEAEKLALENCTKFAPPSDPCAIIMIDDEKPRN